MLDEGLTGVRVIRAFDRNAHQSRRFDAANFDLTRNAIAVNRLAWLKRAWELRRDHPGKFAAFHQGRLVGVVDSQLQAQALVKDFDPPFEQALAFPIDEGPDCTPFESISSEYL